MVRGSNKYFNSHLGRVALELNLKLKDNHQTHLKNKRNDPKTRLAAEKKFS